MTGQLQAGYNPTQDSLLFLRHHWPCASGAMTGQLQAGYNPSQDSLLFLRHHWPCASGAMTGQLQQNTTHPKIHPSSSATTGLVPVER